MKALILKNKVVDLSETEFPVSSEMKWVDCDDTVKRDYEYKDGTFTKPSLTIKPEQVLRNKRNLLLTQSDWEMLKGLETGADMTALKKYRQDLRDLPSTAKPKLEENGQLTNVTWPIKPEQAS
jgi:hypothetical protein